MKAMVALRDGTLAQVNVYRNGDVVTIAGQGVQKTPKGEVKVAVQAQMNVETFEWCRKKAIEKVGTLVYTRLIGRLGVDDDVRRAPPLPPAMQNSQRLLARGGR